MPELYEGGRDVDTKIIISVLQEKQDFVSLPSTVNGNML